MKLYILKVNHTNSLDYFVFLLVKITLNCEIRCICINLIFSQILLSQPVKILEQSFYFIFMK